MLGIKVLEVELAWFIWTPRGQSQDEEKWHNGSKLMPVMQSGCKERARLLGGRSMLANKTRKVLEMVTEKSSPGKCVLEAGIWIL